MEYYFCAAAEINLGRSCLLDIILPVLVSAADFCCRGEPGSANQRTELETFDQLAASITREGLPGLVLEN